VVTVTLGEFQRLIRDTFGAKDARRRCVSG
jgi:hypothetical protein